jgi:ankyrin repeat protein
MKAPCFRRLVLFILFLCVSFLGFGQKSPAKPNLEDTEFLLALAIRYGRFDDLKTAIEDKKYPVNRRFSSGFTPLHAMVWSAANKPKEDTANSRMMIDYLIRKGASTKMKVPPFKAWTKLLAPHDSDGIRAASEDSVNALQLAMLCGNIQVVKVMLTHDPNTTVTDKNGNTLLHLAAMYDYNAKFDDRFVVQASDLLMMERNVVNKAGQNPLVYYVSKPQWVTTAKLVIDHMIKAGTNPDLRDKAGKNFYDYGKTVNPWINDWLQQKAEAERVNKILENFRKTPPVDFEKQTQENLARYEAWKKRNGGCGDTKLNFSYSLRFTYYLSSPYSLPVKGQKCSANEEPIEVVVTPDRISISTLSPYYGSFQVCESDYKMVNGVEYEYYTFKTGSTNTTYTGFGRKRGDSNNAIFFTESGSIMLGVSAFQYQ